MRLSKATGYGIRALAYMAREAAGRPCGLREISEHENIPPIFLRKVLGELRRHRLVRSAMGIHGGYELARSPGSISLWDVATVLERDPDWNGCILGPGLHPEGASCPLDDDCSRLEREMRRFLSDRTIAGMAQRPRRTAAAE